MSVTVVSVGDDPQLLSLREAVLRSVGMRVLTTADRNTAISYIEAGNADVLLLCYSLPIEARQQLIRRFRDRCPRRRIIAVTNMPQSRPPIDADAFLYGIEGAEALIQAVSSLAENDARETAEHQDPGRAGPQSDHSNRGTKRRLG